MRIRDIFKSQEQLLREAKLDPDTNARLRAGKVTPSQYIERQRKASGR